MEAFYIFLIFAGLVGLMILFKALFGRSSPAKQQTLPPAAAAHARRAGRGMGAVAKQAFPFAEAAMLLPREIGIKSDHARLGAAFFIAGATNFVAQKNGANYIEYVSVLSVLLVKVGLLTEFQAEKFVDSLFTSSVTQLGQDGMIKGGNAISDWLSDKDDNAPARLLTYIEEWSSQAGGA